MMTTLAKLQEPEIDATNIWGDDVFKDRKDLAEKYTNLLDTITQPFVIALNAPYGSGKSYFLKRWHTQLEEDNRFVSLFYNAWQTDFHEHAFIPFMYFMIEAMDAKSLMPGSLYKRLIDVTGSIVSGILKNGAEKISLDLIKREDIENAIHSVKSKTSHEFFDAYKQRKEKLEEFKNILREIVIENQQKDQKLVIFIDELERCRPTHAIELLESIKHLFDIDGIVFVLGTDRGELQHTISNLYGQKMNADGYIRRFIDLELLLPKPSNAQFIEFLYKSYQFDTVIDSTENLFTGGNTLIRFMHYFSQAFSLDIRMISQCFTELNMCIRFLPKGTAFIPVIFTLLICLKHKKTELFQKLGNEWSGVTGISEINNLLSNITFSERDKKIIQIYLYVAFDDQHNNITKLKIEESTLSANPNEDEAKLLNLAQVALSELRFKYDLPNNRPIILILKEMMDITTV